MSILNSTFAKVNDLFPLFYFLFPYLPFSFKQKWTNYLLIECVFIFQVFETRASPYSITLPMSRYSYRIEALLTEKNILTRGNIPFESKCNDVRVPTMNAWIDYYIFFYWVCLNSWWAHIMGVNWMRCVGNVVGFECFCLFWCRRKVHMHIFVYRNNKLAWNR